MRISFTGAAAILGKWMAYLILASAIRLDVSVAIAEPSEQRPETLDAELPMVLTPSQLPQRLDESPSAVTVIDRQMIEATGARTLVEVLRLVPGFHVGHKVNNLPTAAYHGLADEFARRMLLLVDGQRVFQYSRGVIEWSNLPLPLENVERIEVVRGPNAAAYGSNAFQGVINIQTRSPAEDNGFYGRATVGDNGVADGFVRYGGKLGALDYAVSLFSRGDHGYDGLVDDTRNTGISMTAELPVSEGGSVKLMAGYSRGDYEIDNSRSSLAANAPEARREMPAEDNFQTVQWRQTLGDDAELTATLSHNRFYYGDKDFTNDRLIPDTKLRIRFDLTEERYGADFKVSKLFSEQWRGVAGLGYQYERNRAPYYFATNDTLDNSLLRIYGHAEYRPSQQWVFNAGTMLERSDLSAKDWLFLPRFSAHYHLNDRHTFRAGFSTGSRQPTLYESQARAIITADDNPFLTIYRVFATGKDNGGLDPEMIQSFELGYQWFPSRSSYLDLRVFHEKLSDLTVAFYRENSGLLTVLPNQTVLDFANEDDITIQGVEAQLDWRNDSGFRLFASYALTDIDGDGTRYNNGYEDSAPSHSFGLLASQQFGHGWEASLNYDYQSAMQWYFDEPIDSYHKLDLRLAKRLPWGTGQALAELICTNLLEPVSDYLPDQAWDRGVLLRFSADF